MAIVPVSCQLSLKAVGAALGVKRVEMCEPTVAQRITGYVLGGISPFGQRKRLPTVIDETCELYDVVYVSGGRRGLDLGVAPADLIGVLGAIDGRHQRLTRRSSAGRVAEHGVDAGDSGAGRGVRSGEAGPPADRALPTAEGDHPAQRLGQVAPVAHPHHAAIGLELGAVSDDVAEGVRGVEGDARTVATGR